MELILDILAYLSPDGINEVLLQEGWKRYNQQDQIEAFDNALELLHSYSIVTLNTTRVFPTQNKEKENNIGVTTKIKVHRITQQVVRLNHQRSKIYESRYRNVFYWVAAELLAKIKNVEDAKRSRIFCSS